jgi:formate dehydrogenase (coenzyme F420) beta subunit
MAEPSGGNTWFLVPGDEPVGAARHFAADLLGPGGMRAVLIPRRSRGGAGSPPALVATSAGLEGADAFAGVMPSNAGAAVAAMTGVEAFPEPTAAFLRPCESRALVELAKLKQANLGNLLIVGTDCPGTVPVKEYADRVGKAGAEADLARRLAGGAEGLRDACKGCLVPSAPVADLRLALYGAAGRLWLEGVTEAGRKAAAALGYSPVVPNGRDAALASERDRRARFRKEAEEAVLAKVQGKDALLAFLQRCIGCHNCRTVCPVCYCKECFFDSPTFEIEAAKFLGWAKARGALRVPADTLLFHLTRMNHMAHSCVACGMCTQACPSLIEVGALFSAIGGRVQALFRYEPGRSLEDEIPLATFREDELRTFGGR